MGAPSWQGPPPLSPSLGSPAPLHRRGSRPRPSSGAAPLVQRFSTPTRAKCLVRGLAPARPRAAPALAAAMIRRPTGRSPSGASRPPPTAPAPPPQWRDPPEVPRSSRAVRISPAASSSVDQVGPVPQHTLGPQRGPSSTQDRPPVQHHCAGSDQPGDSTLFSTFSSAPPERGN
ncbi:hypothetical protein NDU88_006970 [Pleurodeles waltl]|uniref:Uncharacterized protein n=1 Tax=Pleurodeles waltl TaxID=8319 RepID=A0AAV7NZM3_PLEWA|nr:hypothetical protein NDU88_006970 [Pleurodeles waltl]